MITLLDLFVSTDKTCEYIFLKGYTNNTQKMKQSVREP